MYNAGNWAVRRVSPPSPNRTAPVFEPKADDIQKFLPKDKPSLTLMDEIIKRY